MAALQRQVDHLLELNRRTPLAPPQHRWPSPTGSTLSGSYDAPYSNYLGYGPGRHSNPRSLLARPSALVTRRPLWHLLAPCCLYLMASASWLYDPLASWLANNPWLGVAPALATCIFLAFLRQQLPRPSPLAQYRISTVFFLLMAALPWWHEALDPLLTLHPWLYMAPASTACLLVAYFRTPLVLPRPPRPCAPGPPAGPSTRPPAH